MNSAIKIAASIFVVSLVAACATPRVQEEVSAEFSVEGLHKVSSSGFDQAYVYPGAKLSSYPAVNIMPLQSANAKVTNTVVSGTTRQDWQMTDERVANLANAWASAMDRAFAKYTQGAEGKQVLRVTAEITRVIPGRTSETSTAGGGKPAMGSAESVDIEAEFRLYDQSSDKLLALIRDRRAISILLWTRAGGAEMGNLFNSWAGSLQHRISGK